MNTTASLVVSEALAISKLVTARVIETSLYSAGAVGTIMVEGPERNPNTADLAAEFYALLHSEVELASVIFSNYNHISRQAVGQGCGSLTMAMSDGRLSLFAAGMAEFLLDRQQEGLSVDTGEILVGKLTEDNIGLTWHTYKVKPIKKIKPSKVLGKMNAAPWLVHLHDRAAIKIGEETTRYPGLETGGILIGKLSETARVANIVDVLAAPPDSVRSAREFILGTNGLTQQVTEYVKSVDYSLQCLGTWHNHLDSSGPSSIDEGTARFVAEKCSTPSFFLIHSPAGYHAYIAYPNTKCSL